eukprot:gb/GEZN01003379.1/.p1 GENE.gb/GEZN01003379.1/~~gb/GEZN01003379.1/.p1  ORF type:complete len:621 (-),score=142.34 gb/GEZN01003379.1/:300-2162(-)
MPHLSREELTEAKLVFDSFDKDHGGSIDEDELALALTELKLYESKDQVKALIKEVDLNQNGEIEMNEFIDILERAKQGGGVEGFAELYKKGKAMIQVKKEGGGLHSFSPEETDAFSEHFNQILGDDEDLKYLLPIEIDGKSLLKAVADGVLLSKFINIAVPETIDERALNIPKNGKELSLFKRNENLTLCVEAARSIGVVTTNVGAAELREGETNPHVVLGLVWQLVKIALLNSISLKNCPELIRLLEEGETLEDLLKLTPEQLLLRWFNFHLKNGGYPKKIKNFSGDVKDGKAYTVLLNQIAPKTCDLEANKEADPNKRAQMVLNNAAKLEVKTFIKPKDIVGGNPRLNLAFTAAIFNQNPGLAQLSKEELEKAGLLEDDVGDSREERAFRMWINSLGIPDLYINNLFEDLKSGLGLLKLIDRIEPGTVEWKKKVEGNPNNKFKKVSNNNYAIDLGKAEPFKLSIVGIGGPDIVAGNKKLILGIVWQLMRYHTLKFLKEVLAEKFQGRDVKEEDIIKWCNDRVASSGSARKMKTMKDSSLKDGLFFLDLLGSIKKDLLDEQYIFNPAEDEKQQRDNARYVISVARKLGATIFLLPEDINEVKQKMILTLCASIMSVSAS